MGGEISDGYGLGGSGVRTWNSSRSVGSISSRVDLPSMLSAHSNHPHRVSECAPPGSHEGEDVERDAPLRSAMYVCVKHSWPGWLLPGARHRNTLCPAAVSVWNSAPNTSSRDDVEHPAMVQRT